MSIAIIKTGGKQYKVSKDQVLKIEKIKGKEGDKTVFDQVLLVSDDPASAKATAGKKDPKVEIGQPFLKDKKVEAEILEQGRARKVEIVKYKRKTRYRRKVGHRQPFTRIKIVKI